MTDHDTSKKKGITPPKGRPTRGRDEPLTERRVFGPTAQWITLVFVIALLLIAVIVFFDGGDFNPFNDVDLGG